MIMILLFNDTKCVNNRRIIITIIIIGGGSIHMSVPMTLSDR